MSKVTVTPAAPLPGKLRACVVLRYCVPGVMPVRFKSVPAGTEFETVGCEIPERDLRAMYAQGLVKAVPANAGTVQPVAEAEHGEQAEHAAELEAGA